MGGSIANVRPMSGFMSLTQPRSLLMSMTPNTTKGQENRAVQRWSRHSLVEALRRKGPIPLLGSTID